MRGYLGLVTRFGGIVIMAFVIFSHAFTQGDDNLRIQHGLNNKVEEINK